MLNRFIKKAIKNIVFPIAYAMGADNFFQKKSRNKKLVIMYHGVTSRNCFKINGRHLPAKEFEKHLLYYKKHFNIVSLAVITAMRQKNEIPEKPTIALTFDDGYSNNLLVALPILEKHKIPATFFLTTLPMEKQGHILHGDLIEIGCAYSRENIVKLGNTQFKKAGKYRWISDVGQNIYSSFQNKRTSEKAMLINTWKEKYKLNETIEKLDEQCYKLMNEAEVKQLSLSPWVEIGSHTHSHHYLTLLNDEELKFELEHSKNILEKITGSKIESIAFPDGVYDDRVIEFCHKTGYKNLIGVGLNKKEDCLNSSLFARVGSSNSDKLAFNIITVSRFFGIHGF